MLRILLGSAMSCAAIAGCGPVPEAYRSPTGFNPVRYDGGFLLDLRDRGNGAVETVDKVSGMNGVLYTRRITMCGSKTSRVLGAGYKPTLMDNSAADPTMSTLIEGTAAMDLAKLACVIARRPLGG